MYDNNDDECGIPPAILVHVITVIIVIIIRVWYASLCRHPITIIYNIWTCDRFIRDEHTVLQSQRSFHRLYLSHSFCCCYIFVVNILIIDHTNVILNSILYDCVKFSSQVTWTTVYRNKLIEKIFDFSKKIFNYFVLFFHVLIYLQLIYLRYYMASVVNYFNYYTR